MCSSAVALQEQGLTCSYISRFGSKRCICTLELAASSTGLEGVFSVGALPLQSLLVQIYTCFIELGIKGCFSFP